MLWGDPCCHGNEIWARRGDPVAYRLVSGLYTSVYIDMLLCGAVIGFVVETSRVPLLGVSLSGNHFGLSANAMVSIGADLYKLVPGQSIGDRDAEWGRRGREWEGVFLSQPITGSGGVVSSPPQRDPGQSPGCNRILVNLWL